MSNASKLLLFFAAGLTLRAETVRFRQRCLDDLVADVPVILKTLNPQTGRFGTGIWIVTDQNPMFPLAVAWSYKDARNPYYHSEQLLTAIMSAGDALTGDQDADGKWEFRKKDGSTWGQIYMPWTYSRWIRAFQLIHDAMPADRRAKWEKALLLGYTGIAKEINTDRIQNIPSHHAMGLYFAGQVFHKPEWKQEAAEYLHKVVAAQHPDGYWSENKGPVVSYGFVYVDAVGTYYGVSHDPAVLPALRRSGTFHYYFTYPDGSNVETVDERNPYHDGVAIPNVGFAFTPEGRSYIARQWRLHKGRIPSDSAASLLMWGEEGESAATDVNKSDFDYHLPSGEAAIRRRGPWFIVISAMTAPVPNSRWIQDRQNFVSIFHERVGLILGGGNTKLQPAWSNFTAGDTTKFFHRPGDENPNFQPPAGLLHVPASARLMKDEFGVELEYGRHHARILVDVKDADHLEMKLAGDAEMTGHVTLLPHLQTTLVRSSGEKSELSEAFLQWTASAPGDWIEHNGAKILLPPSASVRWPLLPHDPYKKDGRATPDEGRIVIDAPVSPSAVFTVEVHTERK